MGGLSRNTTPSREGISAWVVEKSPSRVPLTLALPTCTLDSANLSLPTIYDHRKGSQYGFRWRKQQGDKSNDDFVPLSKEVPYKQQMTWCAPRRALNICVPTPYQPASSHRALNQKHALRGGPC